MLSILRITKNKSCENKFTCRSKFYWKLFQREFPLSFFIFVLKLFFKVSFLFIAQHFHLFWRNIPEASQVNFLCIFLVNIAWILANRFFFCLIKSNQVPIEKIGRKNTKIYFFIKKNYTFVKRYTLKFYFEEREKRTPKRE